MGCEKSEIAREDGLLLVYGDDGYSNKQDDKSDDYDERQAEQGCILPLLGAFRASEVRISGVACFTLHAHKSRMSFHTIS